MPGVLDIEQALLLLELEPPFDQRQVQLARRRQAKRWHPDIAPPGKQFEHERHLKAINEAADTLESLAEGSRGGRVSRNAVKVSAAAARAARAEAGAQGLRGGAAPPRAGRRPRRSTTRSAPASPTTRSCTATRAASPTRSGASARSRGIYFTGDGDDVQQWARVKFQVGVRTIPAGSLQFVDFSKPDPGADRVQRFVTAAQHAMAEEDYALAAQRLIYARDAEPDNAVVLRMMTLAFWQAGNLPAAGRSVRDWIRVEGDRPTPHRFASRIYADMRAYDLAIEAAQRAADRAPADASAWERVGRLRAAPRPPRARHRRAGARALARPDGRGAARPRARPPARGRPRRGGHRGRAGDARRRRVRGGMEPLRARARAHRPGQRRHRARPSGRSSSTRRTPRSPTFSSTSARRCHACCPRRDPTGHAAPQPRRRRAARGGGCGSRSACRACTTWRSGRRWARATSAS